MLFWSKFGKDNSHHFGGKAQNLAVLKENGFPVPETVVVSSDAHTAYKRTGKIDSALIQQLEVFRKQFGGQVALRSSANCEDGTDLSMAGVFETIYLQDESQTIEAALSQIYDQSQSDSVHRYLELHGSSADKVEMGVILQRLIIPEISGVMYTGTENDQTLIQYTHGFGDQLVDGLTEGSSVVYSGKQQRVLQSHNTEENSLSLEQIQKLQKFSMEIQEVFQGLPQDIEFAIEGENIFILQARTLTAEMPEVHLEMSRGDVIRYTRQQIEKIIEEEKAELGTDSVILSDSNFSELLPRPKEMDFGVFATIFTGSNGIPGAIQLGRQEMGYPLEDESIGFMYYVGGKPYFSIARDAHTFYAGFPESKQEYTDTLVTEYLSEIEQDPSKGEYPEMGLYLQDPTEDDLLERYGSRGHEYFSIYQEFKENMAHQADLFLSEYLERGKPATDFFIEQMESVTLTQLNATELVEYIQEILEHLRTESCVNFVKSARLGFYYSQRLQQLLRDNFEMSEDEVGETFSRLNQGLEGSEITQANLAIAAAPSLQKALTIGRRGVGHYSAGEMLEIRHPRLKDDAAKLRIYVEGIFASGKNYLKEFQKQKSERLLSQQKLLQSFTNEEEKEEFDRAMRASQTYMALRETVKYQFTKEYALIRDALVELAERVGMETEALFSLYPGELSDFAEDPDSFQMILSERLERFEKYSHLDLPPVIRESDLELLGEEDEESFANSVEFFGKLLAQGKALEEAIIVNIEDFETVEAARDVLLFYRKQALPIVLVASQMNLSHDPLIMQADGLVIENAGLVSHGAQRARELGRGAIGGIKTRYLKTGQSVSFDPKSKKVQLL